MRFPVLAVLLLGLNGCVHVSPDLQRQQCIDTRPPTPPTCDEQERARAAHEALLWSNLALSLSNLAHVLSHIR